MKPCRWSPGLWKGHRVWGRTSTCCFWGHKEEFGGQISQRLVPQITLVWDTWLDSVSEWEGVFPECFCILAFMSVHELTAHRFLLSNQVHQSVVEMRGEERPSDSDFAQTKLSLVSKDREEHPRLLTSDCPPTVCGAVQMGGFLWQDKQLEGSTLVC